MKTKRKDREEKNRKNKPFYTSFPFIALLLLTIVALLFFVWHQRSLEQATQQQEIISQDLSNEIAVPEQVGSETNTALTSQDTVITNERTDKKAPITKNEKLNESVKPPTDITESQIKQNTATPPNNSQSLPDESAANVSPSLPVESQYKPFQNARCQETTKFVDEFFHHLDSQQYLKNYQIEPDSKTYFIALMQKTLNNPPVVSGETDDLYTILQNTAHFFRVIGNTNIAILKNILSNEKSQFENIAAEFYSLVTSPACAEHSFDLKISKPALYEYAGFFLNTMGGRLYLFRRDSISRMVISYYSILLIDKANIESFNKHGIELSISIDLLISEMESTTNTLKLKETYLNMLYALQEQYQH